VSRIHEDFTRPATRGARRSRHRPISPGRHLGGAYHVAIFVSLMLTNDPTVRGSDSASPSASSLTRSSSGSPPGSRRYGDPGCQDLVAPRWFGISKLKRCARTSWCLI